MHEQTIVPRGLSHLYLYGHASLLSSKPTKSSTISRSGQLLSRLGYLWLGSSDDNYVSQKRPNGTPTLRTMAMTGVGSPFIQPAYLACVRVTINSSRVLCSSKHAMARPSKTARAFAGKTRRRH